jgi:hypothetical protein
MAWHLAKVLSSLWFCAEAEALVFELEKPSVSSMANLDVYVVETAARSQHVLGMYSGAFCRWLQWSATV